MQMIGYSLVRLSDGVVVAGAYALPCRCVVDGVGTADFDKAGQVIPDSEAPTHKLVERWIVGEPSTARDALVSEVQSFDGEKVTVTRVWSTPAPTQQELKQYAAEKRRGLERGSTTVNVGSRLIPIWVDPESRASAMGLVLTLGIVPDLTTKWKGSDGAFYDLATAEITPMALGMMAFVQQCFNAEEAALAAIDSGEITSLAQLDAIGWPQEGA